MSDHVTELRLVLRVDDFDAALHIYRDLLGMRELDAVSSPGGRVAILDAGRATLELADPPHAAYIDEVEVGRQVAGPARLALRVHDVDAQTDRLARTGVEVIAPPTATPWGSRNARLSGSPDVQLTLFGPDSPAVR